MGLLLFAPVPSAPRSKIDNARPYVGCEGGRWSMEEGFHRIAGPFIMLVCRRGGQPLRGAEIQYAAIPGKWVISGGGIAPSSRPASDISPFTRPANHSSAVGYRVIPMGPGRLCSPGSRTSKIARRSPARQPVRPKQVVRRCGLEARRIGAPPQRAPQ